MKILGVREARNTLSECIEMAKRERVIITNHGKPTALLVNIEGLSLEDVVAPHDRGLPSLIAKAARLGHPAPKRAAAKRPGRRLAKAAHAR